MWSGLVGCDQPGIRLILSFKHRWRDWIRKVIFFPVYLGFSWVEVPALFAKTVESCIFTISPLLHEVWKKRLQLLVFCHFSSLGLCLTTVLTQIFNKWDPSSQQQLTHQTHVCQAMSAPTAIWINSQKSSFNLGSLCSGEAKICSRRGLFSFWRAEIFWKACSLFQCWNSPHHPLIYWPV